MTGMVIWYRQPIRRDIGRLFVIETVDSDEDSVVSSYQYSYDGNGRRTAVTSRDGNWAYSYDATGQLIEAAFTSDNPDIADTDLSYSYDAVGNRLEKIQDGNTTSYTTNLMNQYTDAGEFSYSYDTDGNLIAKTDGVDSWLYDYDSSGRLVRSSGPGGEKEYIYNGLGQLAVRITDGSPTYFMTDPTGFGNLVGEYDELGTETAHYTHGFGLLSKDDNFYTFDGNGNTSELTNASGDIVNYYVSQLQNCLLVQPLRYVKNFILGISTICLW